MLADYATDDEMLGARALAWIKHPGRDEGAAAVAGRTRSQPPCVVIDL
ncbi:hypothetical protein ACFU7Z_10675 [Kitasatospora sp. NPDC057518]